MRSRGSANGARVWLAIAVAPIVGTARVVSAAGNLARALGFAIEAMAIEAELDAEDD